MSTALLTRPASRAQSVASAILSETSRIQRLENAFTGVKYSAIKKKNGAFAKIDDAKEQAIIEKVLDRIQKEFMPSSDDEKIAYRERLVAWGLDRDAGMLKTAMKSLEKFKVLTLSPAIKKRVVEGLDLKSRLVNVGSGGFALGDGSFLKVHRSQDNAFKLSLVDAVPPEVCIDDQRTLKIDSKWAKYGLGLAEPTGDDKFLIDFVTRIICSMFNGENDVITLMLRFFAVGCVCQAADLLKLLIVHISGTGGGKSTLQELLNSLFYSLCKTDSSSGMVDTQTSPMIVEADFLQRQGSSGGNTQKSVKDGRERACGLGIAMPRVSASVLTLLTPPCLHAAIRVSTISTLFCPSRLAPTQEIQTVLDHEKVKMHTAGERKTITIETKPGKKIKVDLPHVGVMATCNPAQLGGKPTDADALAKIACIGPKHTHVPSGKPIFTGYGESVPQYLPPIVFPKPTAKPDAYIACERKEDGDTLVATGWGFDGHLIFTTKGQSGNMLEFIDPNAQITEMQPGQGYPKPSFAQVFPGGTYIEATDTEPPAVEVLSSWGKHAFVRSEQGVSMLTGIKPSKTTTGFKYALNRETPVLKTTEVQFYKYDNANGLVYFKNSDISQYDRMVDDEGMVYYAHDIKDSSIRTACQDGTLSGAMLTILAKVMVGDPRPIYDFAAQYVPKRIRDETDDWSFGPDIGIPEILVAAMKETMVVLDPGIKLEACKGSTVGMTIHAILTHRKEGKKFDTDVKEAAFAYFGEAVVDHCATWKYRRPAHKKDKNGSAYAPSPPKPIALVGKLNALLVAAFGDELKVRTRELKAC